jgi:DNA-binding transcriptional MerR regulator
MDLVRISELARRAGVPVGTVKYYLREGLLPAGTPTSATQAQYGAEHVARLGLIRVLVGTGGLSIAAARAALQVIDDPAPSIHDVIGTAHQAIGPVRTAAPEDIERARELVVGRGWRVAHDSPGLAQLGAALAACDAAGITGMEHLVERYAAAAEQLAAFDVAGVPTTSPADAVRFVVVGTVLLEPLLLALRRLAQQDASARRFADPALTPE